MKFQTSLILVPFLNSSIFAQTFNEEGNIEETWPIASKNQFSISDFQQLLFTELDDEIGVVTDTLTAKEGSSNPAARKLHYDGDATLLEAQTIFDHIIDHSWELSKSLHQDGPIDGQPVLDSRLLSASPHIMNNGDKVFPYLVCSRTPLLKSGVQRLAPVLQFTGAQLNDAIIVSNNDEQTCFQISTTHDKASIVDSSLSNDECIIIPMADLMKISTNTFNQIDDSNWAIPSPEEVFRWSLKGTEANHAEWERTIRVGVVPGLNIFNDTDILTEAKTILDLVKHMGVNGSLKNQRRLMKSNNTTDPNPPSMSLSDVFSLTSSFGTQKSNKRRTEVVAAGRQWLRVLQSGIESDHYCEAMFDQIEIRESSDPKVFDIVLNPLNPQNANDPHNAQMNNETFMIENIPFSEATASNKDCVRSLVIGLSVHPHVLSIEAELPISFDDTEAQWISQSNVPGSRPFYDRGL